MPPAVLPGEPPMNINIPSTKSDAGIRLPVSIVLKPAVLAVTD